MLCAMHMALLLIVFCYDLHDKEVLQLINQLTADLGSYMAVSLIFIGFSSTSTSEFAMSAILRWDRGIGSKQTV